MAQKLEGCRPQQRCGSGACDVCLRIYRLKHIGEGTRLLGNCAEVRTVSATPHWGTAEVGELSTVDLGSRLEPYVRGLKRTVPSGTLIIGGADVSLNTFENADPHWCVHPYFVIGATDRAIDWDAVRSYCRRHAPTADSGRVFRPVRISRAPVPSGELSVVLGYALKSVFSWRSAYTDVRKKTGRPFRNSRDLPIPSNRGVELWLFLDRYRIADRVMLAGVRRHGDGANFVLHRQQVSGVTLNAPKFRRSR
ncbi:MAG: hypothetical protein AB7I79_15145 [Rhizobiaceae bacterium]